MFRSILDIVRSMPVKSVTAREQRGSWIMRWVFPSCLALMFGAYLISLARGVTASDGPEIATAVVTLGVIHPTGYPLFTLIAHLFTLFPAPVEPIIKIEFMNALFALAASAYCGLATRGLALRVQGLLPPPDATLAARWPRVGGPEPTESRVQPVHSVHPARQSWEADLACVITALVVGTSPMLWQQLRIPEVYAMHVLLVSAALYAWTRFELTRQQRYILVAAVPMGLGLAHHVTIVYMMPAALVYLLWRRPYFLVSWVLYPIVRVARSLASGRFAQLMETTDFRGWWIVWAGCLIGGLPLLLYFYLPWANAHTSGVSWGGVTNFDSAYRHFTAQPYQAYMQGFGYVRFWDRVAELPGWFDKQFFTAAAPVCLIGIIVVVRRFGPLALMMAIYGAWNVYHGVQYWTGDYYNYYLPAVCILGIALGLGVWWIARLIGLRSRKRSGVGAFAPLSLALLTIVLGSYGTAAAFRMVEFQNAPTEGAHYAADVVDGVARGGVFMGGDMGRIFPLWYFQHALAKGRDMAVVGVRVVHRDWYRKNYLQRRHPAECDPFSQRYIDDIEAWQRDCGSYEQRLELAAQPSWLKLDVSPLRPQTVVDRETPLAYTIIDGGQSECQNREIRGKNARSRERCRCWDFNTVERIWDEVCVHTPESGGVVGRSKFDIFAHRIIEDHIDERGVYERGVLSSWLRRGGNARGWDGPAHHRVSDQYTVVNRGQANQIVYFEDVSGFDSCASERLEPLPLRAFEQPGLHPIRSAERRPYQGSERPLLISHSWMASLRDSQVGDASRSFEQGEELWLTVHWFERFRFDAAKSERRGEPIRFGVRTCFFDPEGIRVHREAVTTSGQRHSFALAAVHTQRAGRYTVRACAIGDLAAAPSAEQAKRLEEMPCLYPILEYEFEIQ